MHVICDCTVALTETLEDVEVEGSQKVTVHNGHVRLNGLRIRADFSCWKHFCSSTLLLGQAQGMLIFSWPISAASTSSYSFLFWVVLAPTLFSSSALSHLSPTSLSAFHPNFKARLSLPLQAFPTSLHNFSFQAADLWAAHFLTHVLFTGGSSLSLASRIFHLVFPNHWFLWSLLNFSPQRSLPKAFMALSWHTDTQQTLAQSCCISCSICIYHYLLVSESCLLNTCKYGCQFSPSFTLLLFTLPFSISRFALAAPILLPTYALSDLPLLLWRTASGNPTARLTAAISNSFQILGAYIPFLNSLEKNSANYTI